MVLYSSEFNFVRRCYIVSLLPADCHSQVSRCIRGINGDDLPKRFLCFLNTAFLLPTTAARQKPLRFIDTLAALQKCTDELSACDTIAFDLEFDSHNHSYGVTLCLIQVAAPDCCYVIDPFAVTGLSKLYALLEDERILKIVHSPGEDLRLLHSLQCYPKNLFDTEVAARLLNNEHTSLAAMLQEKLDHTMNKQQQRSNWLRRPLTPEQLLYAADDVAWLHALKEILEGEAKQKGLMSFVEEEQTALSTTIYRQETKDFFLKPADLRTLSAYEQYVLNALLIYRDNLAKQLNKPAYQVLDEQLLRAIAAGTFQPGDLTEAKGVHRSLKNAGFAAKVSAYLQSIRSEADRLGHVHTMPARQRLLLGQRADRDMAAQDKEAKFAPVQQALVKRFGEHAARFILSNGMANDLLKRTTTISSIKRSYKQTLIRSTAATLSIDLSSYE